jgi:hypothetical protein
MVVPNNIWMRLKFFEDADFPHGGAGYTFIFVFELDFLECDYFFGDKVFCLVDNSVSALNK